MPSHVILDHLGHEGIHRPAGRHDLLQNLVAALFRLQGPLQGFDLSADFAHAGQQLDLFSDRMSYMALIVYTLPR